MKVKELTGDTKLYFITRKRLPLFLCNSREMKLIKLAREENKN